MLLEGIKLEISLSSVLNTSYRVWLCSGEALLFNLKWPATLRMRADFLSSFLWYISLALDTKTSSGEVKGYEDEFTKTQEKTAAVLRESHSTYTHRRMSVIDFCQGDWLLLMYLAQGIVGRHSQDASVYCYAKGDLKGNIGAPLLSIEWIPAALVNSHTILPKQGRASLFIALFMPEI